MEKGKKNKKGKKQRGKNELNTLREEFNSAADLLRLTYLHQPLFL